MEAWALIVNGVVENVIVGPEGTDEEKRAWFELAGGTWVPTPDQYGIDGGIGHRLCDVHDSFACNPDCITGEWLIMVSGMSPEERATKAFFMDSIFECSAETYVSTNDDFTLVQRVRDVQNAAPSVVVDMGAGVGVIGIVVARAVPDCTAYLVEPRLVDLSFAEINAASGGFAPGSTVHVVSGTAATADLPIDGTVDVVISNSPGDPSHLLSDIDLAYALDGGPDGFTMIREVVARSKSLLRPGGTLIFRSTYIPPAECAALVLDEVDWHVLPSDDDFVEAIRKG